jgi:hypothetical protein
MTDPRPNMVDELTVRLALIRACKEAGTYKNFAYGHNISPTSVWEVVNGLHAPGGKILAALGFEKVIRYVRKPSITSGEQPRTQAELVP